MNSFVMLSIFRNFETLSRNYFRSEIKIKTFFILYSAHLFVILQPENYIYNVVYGNYEQNNEGRSGCNRGVVWSAGT